MKNLLNSIVTTQSDRKYHLWIPDIFEHKGGIQTYSSFFLQAMQKIDPEADYHVFLKHDIGKSSNICYLPDTQFYFTGKVPLSLRTFIYAQRLFFYGLLHKPNLIITTHLNFTIVAYWLKKLLGIPYWTVAHGIEAWNINNSKLQRALQNADKILAVSNYTRERLIAEQNLNPQRIKVLPNTFDSHRFKIAPKPKYLLEKYNLHPKQPIILTVARLAVGEQYKGYDRVILALPIVKKIIPDVHFFLIGQGNDTPRIKQMIEELKLQNYVTLTGFISDEKLGDYYNLCDLFAMPSKKEGFGIVYLESLASGKPTLGGNQDGAIDALCNGQLGALVDPDNLEQIAQTIIDILQQKYANNLIYHPEELREKAIDLFGFQSFQKTLCSYLE